MKKRILFCTEASHLKSGYAIYARELIQRLHETQRYTIAEFASYSDIETASRNPTPWQFYPNAVGKDDERHEKYKSNYSNQFGHWRFDIVCLDFKPDVVIDFRDPWMFEHEAFSSLRKYFKWIIMPPVDSVPQKNDWIRTFIGADLVIPYTKWAKQEFSKYNINVHHEPALAGVDFNTYKPLDRDALREKYGIDKDIFVVGSVMRNQKRKMIPELFQVTSDLIKENKNIILYMHTTYPEAGGWDIPELLMRFNVIDHVLFTYFCKNCGEFYPLRYQGAQCICPHCNEFQCNLSHPNNGVNKNQMAEIYNMFDMYVQYAICEGFGMPQVEAASCGVRMCGIDYSAMSEVIDNIGGEKIEPLSLMYEIESGAQRASHNNDKLKKIILNFRKMQKSRRKKLEENSRTNAIVNYNWQNVARVWEEAIDSVLETPAKHDWNNEPQYDVQESIDIDMQKSNYEIAEYVISKIIREANLIDTNFVRKIIKDADMGFQIMGAEVTPFTKQHLVKKLEQFCNHKKLMDNIRLTYDLKEDYILFGNKAL